MDKQTKRYAITIRGNVQHIGYRGIIEGTARKMEIKGYVFNDTDSSVNIVCEGEAEYVNSFLNVLKDFARADIETIEKKEIQENFPLPKLSGRLATDEYYEFSRKFDIGLDFIAGIKTDTGEMKGTLRDVNAGIGGMKGTLQDVNAGIGDMKGTLQDVNAGIGDMKGTLQDVNEGIGEMKG
ncbi:Acylphosphatase [uncultured archaeon]|nr:Acylphosphatase [uncultured archaeon]